MKKLLFTLPLIGCYSLIEYNPTYNQDINALNPYQGCEHECTDFGDVHCHWRIRSGKIYRGGVNHEWIKDKCNYDLCICMLGCISDNYKTATTTEASQYCYIWDTLWVQNGEDGDAFDYDIWKKNYLKRGNE